MGGYVVYFLLGEDVTAGLALRPVIPSALLDLLITWPVYRLCRRVVGPGPEPARPRQVEVVV